MTSHETTSPPELDRCHCRTIDRPRAVRVRGKLEPGAVECGNHKLHPADVSGTSRVDHIDSNNRPVVDICDTRFR
ncbi:MAG: hypothetical protein KJN63_09725, partial [Acidimicrobiia bacterium]|nr:hypothetical protein [Acidimicrobiia bacterium]